MQSAKICAFIILCRSFNILSMETPRTPTSPFDKIQQTFSEEILQPVPKEFPLLVYAYEHYKENKKKEIPIPQMILLFGEATSGKTYLVNVLKKKINAHLYSFFIENKSEGETERQLKEHLSNVEELLAKQKKGAISLLHCARAQHLLKNVNTALIKELIATHAEKLADTPTLFIAEQQDMPEANWLPYFNQVLEMPSLTPKDRKGILEKFLNINVDWKPIKTSLLNGRSVGQLEQIADEVKLKCKSKESNITTEEINAALEKWESIYENAYKEIDPKKRSYQDMYL